MKKFLMIIALILAAMMLIVSAAAEDEKPSITAHRADGIVIDGNLEDWNLDSPAVIDDASQIIRDAFLWKGPDDVSVKFYLAWNEENLYIAADVKEDTPMGAIEMLPIETEDNMKLYISTDPNADPARTEYGTNDFVIYFIMDGEKTGYWSTALDRSAVPKDVRQRFVSKGMDGGENVLEGYECAFRYNDAKDGFTWEAVVPWMNLSGENPLMKKCELPVYTPAAGDVLSVNFTISDIDYPCPGTEYIPQLAWTGSQKIDKDPSLWGSVTLAE